MTIEDFFVSTKAQFSQCAAPETTPDFLSEGGSQYWFGEDDLGSYVIRQSDHWCQYYEIGSKLMSHKRVRIRSCAWSVKIHDISIADLRPIAAKCHLTSFERIRWITKRKYIILNQ